MITFDGNFADVTFGVGGAMGVVEEDFGDFALGGWVG